MKIFKVFGLLILLVIGGLVVAGGCVYSGYNKTIKLDEAVRSAWAQVDNQL